MPAAPGHARRGGASPPPSTRSFTWSPPTSTSVARSRRWAPHNAPRGRPGRADLIFLLDALSEAGPRPRRCSSRSRTPARRPPTSPATRGRPLGARPTSIRSSIGGAPAGGPALGQFALACFLLVGRLRGPRCRPAPGRPPMWPPPSTTPWPSWSRSGSRRPVGGRRACPAAPRSRPPPRAGHRGSRHADRRPAARRRPGRPGGDQRGRGRHAHRQPPAARRRGLRRHPPSAPSR